MSAEPKGVPRQNARIGVLAVQGDFAEHAADCYEITSLFDGIVFSAPIKMAKPQPEIYHHLFHTYHLSPADCFFLDDKPENIQAAKDAGMDGLVFTGDIDIVKERIGF